MSWSARKPYHDLKKSLREFFSAHVKHIKEIGSKFSEAEKPYLEGSYPEIHLNIPEWDWPSGIEEIPGSSISFPGPDEPPYGVFEDPEDRPWKDEPDLGCELDCPITVDAGGYYIIDFIRRDDPIVSIDVWGPGTISPTSLPNCSVANQGKGKWYYPSCRIYLAVDGDASGGDTVVIVGHTASGSECACGMDVVGGCDMDSYIGYTTLGMQVDETQTLTVKDVGGGNETEGTYIWEISPQEAGSISPKEGLSTTYTAPSNNGDCLQNVTVKLLCGTAVIDSIQIAVNGWTGVEEAYRSIDWADGYKDSGCVTSDPGARCVTGDTYRCDGVVIAANFDSCYCSSDLFGRCDIGVCNGGLQYDNQDECVSDCIESWFIGTSGFPGIPGTIDNRTPEMLAGGCCPEALL